MSHPLPSLFVDLILMIESPIRCVEVAPFMYQEDILDIHRCQLQLFDEDIIFLLERISFSDPISFPNLSFSFFSMSILSLTVRSNRGKTVINRLQKSVHAWISVTLSTTSNINSIQSSAILDISFLDSSILISH